MIGWPLASFEKIKLQKRFYRKLAISFQDTPKLLNTELLYTLSICHIGKILGILLDAQ